MFDLPPAYSINLIKAIEFVNTCMAGGRLAPDWPASRGYDSSLMYRDNLIKFLEGLHKDDPIPFDEVRQAYKDFILAKSMSSAAPHTPHLKRLEFVRVQEELSRKVFGVRPDHTRHSNLIDNMLLRILESIEEGVGEECGYDSGHRFDIKSGICNALYWSPASYDCNIELLSVGGTTLVTELNVRFAAISKLWPEYSGNSQYPVDCEERGAVDAYFYGDNLWEGEYGEARIRLLNFAIDYLKKAALENNQ